MSIGYPHNGLRLIDFQYFIKERKGLRGICPSLGIKHLKYIWLHSPPPTSWYKSILLHSPTSYIMVQEYLITFPTPCTMVQEYFISFPTSYIMVQEYFITFPHPLHHGTRVFYYIPPPPTPWYKSTIYPYRKYLMGVKFYDFCYNIHYMYFPSKKGLPSAIGKWHNKVCPLLKGGGNLVVFYYPCPSEIWPY